MIVVKCMKIVKRDGRTVEYDSDKIRIAINKANNEVAEADKVSLKDIENIIKYIESLGKKRMLVEDIQDIIEEKLMEKKKYKLAKVYIIYRYKRSIIRKSNTIDASILSLLKNGSYNEKNYLDANRQRDVMAGEVSKDLAYRLLLPKNVVEAEKDARIKFCNVEYFTEPIIESSKIDLEDMFDNGTVINKIKIDSPKSFQSACNILVEVVASVASSQTGKIYINFKDLFKYYYLTFDKLYGTYSTLMRNVLPEEQIRAISHTQSFLEVKTGIQTIFYQINTITIGSGLVPRVEFLVDVRDIQTKEEERIVYEFIHQKSEGIKDGDGNILVTRYPKIIYAVSSDSELRNKYDYITKELFNSESEFSIMNERRFDSFLKDIKKFNQGSIAINLAKIAADSLSAEGGDFITSLKENLSYCYEGLLCRNHNLQGIYSDKSPIHWRHGSIARLGAMERIDQYLKKGNSTMALVVCGFESAIKILGDESMKKTIRDLIVDTVKTWNKESTFETIISNDFNKFSKSGVISTEEEEYKKYGITSLADSFEFMKEDYFKEGYIYLDTCKDVDLVNEDIINRNVIIRKSSSVVN